MTCQAAHNYIACFLVTQKKSVWWNLLMTWGKNCLFAGSLPLQTGVWNSQVNFFQPQTFSKQGESEWGSPSNNKVRKNTFTWQNRAPHYSNSYLCQTNLSTKLVYRVIPFQKLSGRNKILFSWNGLQNEGKASQIHISSLPWKPHQCNNPPSHGCYSTICYYITYLYFATN